MNDDQEWLTINPDQSFINPSGEAVWGRSILSTGDTQQEASNKPQHERTADCTCFCPTNMFEN